jgi:hypothetical protein
MRGVLGENRRAAILGAVGLGVVVIALLVHVLTGGSSAPPVFTPTTTTTAGLAGGAPGAVASPTTTLPGTGGQVYTSKDPFAPLVNPSAGSSAGSSGSSSASGTGSSSGSTVSSTGAGSTATTSTTVGGASGAGAAPGGSTSPTSGQEVQVLDVYASGKSTAATIQVAGAQYQVSSGTTFAVNYYVVDLSVSTQCGDFTHGGAPFHACKGQEVLK